MRAEKKENVAHGEAVESWARAAASFAGVCKEIGFSEQDMDGVYGIVKKMGFLFAKRSLSSASLFLDRTAASFDERGLAGGPFAKLGAKYASFRDGSWEKGEDASSLAPEALTWARRRFFLSPVGSPQEAQEAENMKRALAKIEETDFYAALSETVHLASRVSCCRKPSVPLAMAWLVEQAGRQSEKASWGEGAAEGGRVRPERLPGLWKEAASLAQGDAEKRGVFLGAWADSVQMWSQREPQAARRYLQQTQAHEKQAVFLATGTSLSTPLNVPSGPSSPALRRVFRAARSLLGG